MIYPFLIISTIIYLYYFPINLFNNDKKCCNNKCNKVFIYSKINDDNDDYDYDYDYEYNYYCCNMDCVIEAYHQEKINNRQYIIFEE
jgi:hypothetical protein